MIKEKEKMDEKKRSAEQTIKSIETAMKRDAFLAASRMNRQAAYGDAHRNRVYFGELICALRVLRLMGHDATDATWEDDGMLICDFVQIDGSAIY